MGQLNENVENPISLLPCPWCGSEDVVIDFSADWEFVKCNGCDANGPMVESTKGRADRVWNIGPYVDRLEIHAKALEAYADILRAEAAAHMLKAEELLKKASGNPS